MRNVLRKLLAVVRGLVYGYVAYIPIMLLVEHVKYGRIDDELAFYALYYPLGAPFLLTPSGWHNLRTEQVLLNFVGGGLLVVSVMYSLRQSKRSQEKSDGGFILH